MHTESPWRLFGLILFSFTIVVVGYVLISHAFDLFLYPDEALRTGIHAAAGIDLMWFDALVVVMTLVIILGWFRAYRSEQEEAPKRRPSTLWINFYALLSREFHMVELFTWLARSLLGLADKLNRWLRWA
jgi:NADH-quinone oxidoreductase subunit L